MSRNRANLLCWLLIASAVAFSAWSYSSLPDPMPSHWNFDGEVDGHIAKPWGVVVMPAATLGVFFLFRLIPVLSPKGYRTDGFGSTLNVLQVAMVAFPAFVTFLVVCAARGIDVRMNQMIFAAVGLLLIVTGSCLARVRRNFFVGVRTPWTLASEEVWARTHRFAAWVFGAMGLLFIAGAFLRWPAGRLIAFIVALALVPAVYSWLIYRRIEPR